VNYHGHFYYNDKSKEHGVSNIFNWMPIDRSMWQSTHSYMYTLGEEELGIVHMHSHWWVNTSAGIFYLKWLIFVH
jgi:hypothetical protein